MRRSDDEWKMIFDQLDRNATNFRQKTPVKNVTEPKTVSVEEQNRRDWKAKVNRGKGKQTPWGRLYDWTLEQKRSGIPFPSEQREYYHAREQAEVLTNAVGNVIPLRPIIKRAKAA